MIYALANWKWLLGAAVSAILAVLLTTTTIDRNQWRAAARKADATLAQVEVAQKAARIAAQAAHDAQEQRYKDLANAADTQHRDNATVVHAAVADWADAHRVPACPSGAARSTIAAASGSNTGVPASVPQDSVVLSGDDLQACGDAVTYALESHRWAAGLNP